MSEAEIIEEAEIVDNLPAVREATAIVARGEITVAEVVAQHEKIVQIMQAVMRPDVHYGIIPGVGKPSLFKAGAESINVALRLAPHYQSEKIWHDDGHLTVSVVCTLRHIPTGLEISTGEGLCTTRESRYAFRTGGRVCPECGQAAIIKGKAEYGGGWLCFGKKGGCGAKWDDGTDQAREFENAETGKVPNPDLADTYNTVLKMADKRALIAAVLNGTAASDVFTQDVEDSASVSTEPQASVPAEPQRRAEGPPPLKPPTSWSKLTEMVSSWDEPTYELFQAFVRSLARLQFGKEPAEVKAKADKDWLFQKCAGAAVHLREAFDPNTLPYPAADDVRAAFARVLDGQELAIEGEDG
jgi:hypothetical protein